MEETNPLDGYQWGIELAAGGGECGVVVRVSSVTRLCPVRLWGGGRCGRGVHSCGDFHSSQHWRAQGYSQR